MVIIISHEPCAGLFDYNTDLTSFITIDVYGSLEDTVKYLDSQLTQLKTEFLHSCPGGRKVLTYGPRVLKVIVLEI